MRKLAIMASAALAATMLSGAVMAADKPACGSGDGTPATGAPIKVGGIFGGS